MLEADPEQAHIMLSLLLLQPLVRHVDYILGNRSPHSKAAHPLCSRSLSLAIELRSCLACSHTSLTSVFLLTLERVLFLLPIRMFTVPTHFLYDTPPLQLHLLMIRRKRVHILQAPIKQSVLDVLAIFENGMCPMLPLSVVAAVAVVYRGL
jgi:hypothetical protein